jgi:hypothetical protein
MLVAGAAARRAQLKQMAKKYELRAMCCSPFSDSVLPSKHTLGDFVGSDRYAVVDWPGITKGHLLVCTNTRALSHNESQAPY